MLELVENVAGLDRTTIAYWATVGGAVLTLLGLLVGIYTLTRVRRVAKAQTEERRITQELLGIDEIELDLVRVISKLHELADQESNALATELSIKLGAIRGVRRAFELECRPVVDSHVCVAKGFFGQEFVIEQIDHAHSNIDIMTGRTLLIAGFDVMDRLRQACERGVHVRVIGLCEDADPVTLSDALRTVANPAPASPDAYRHQIIDAKNAIIAAVNSWRPSAQKKFQYRMDKCVPRVSLVRTDKMVNLGFLQFYREAQPKELRDREYIKIPANSPTGQVALKHFEIAWHEGITVLPHDMP